MEDQFYYVEPAHAKPFEWILKDNPAGPGCDSTSAEDLNGWKMGRSDHQVTKFRAIIREVSLAGCCVKMVPGTGKLILMKFMYMDKFIHTTLSQATTGHIGKFSYSPRLFLFPETWY
ncbi:hypothetical protein K445DRAFT_160400 [Daldinia sp. EC12]|nr:hypothetical protein K445DRAFT_160400 [Daldinia sp. EC12]